MWLMNTTELNLHPYQPPDPDLSDTPFLPYAILSHTWGDGEVLFEDLPKPVSKELPGHRKIEQSCALARSQNWDTIWIDTCCINKSSSAELSEAINSMYAWYRRSSVCYVYLSDFSLSVDDHGPSGIRNNAFRDDFKNCRWFTRGWTLQELLAPFNVEFYDKDWQFIGDKAELASEISAATGINQKYIAEWDAVSEASVAARLSWASRRQTTRLEDQAYCLLGLFDVNMPLLYGEGHKAFLRLQQEIASNTDDESLFAWCWEDLDRRGSHSGIFADRIDFFASSAEYVPLENDRAPFAITNKGLAITGRFTKIRSPDLNGRFLFSENDRRLRYLLLALNCTKENSPEQLFTIILKCVANNTFVRFLPNQGFVKERFASHCGNTEIQTIYIQQLPYDSKSDLSIQTYPSRLTSRVAILPYKLNCLDYALKHWRVSAATKITPSPHDWKIRFETLLGTRGYAILLFKCIRGSHLTVILDFGVTAGGMFYVAGLRAHADASIFTQTIDARINEVAGQIPLNQVNQDVRVSDGTIVRLLSISQPTGYLDVYLLEILAPTQQAHRNRLSPR
ncbi:MAG: hypothetical protein Q9204_002437 [Flavoplaca sp. TL-2023a]